MRIPILSLFVGACGIIFSSASATPQSIPATITGKWRIVKIIPTQNPQCWDQDRARTLVGTTIVYQAQAMAWQGGAEPIREAIPRTLTRQSFADEYKVDLKELGIAAPSVEEIDLQHEDADITGATTEVPGDTILLAGPGRIVVSACGVFYSAVRVAAKTAGAP